MVEWLAAQGHEVRVITARLTTRSGRWARTIPPGGTNGRGGRHGVALPAVRAKTAEHSKRLLHLGSFAVSSFFPLMAHVAGSRIALSAWCQRCFARRNAPAGETVWCAYRAAYSGLRVDAMLGLGLAGKGKGGKVARWQRRSNVADCITSITSPRFAFDDE